MIVARDPVGVRPLFYAVGQTGDTPIAFASEAKALIGGPGVRKVERFPPGHFWRRSQPDSFVPFTDMYNPKNRFLKQSRETATGAVRVLLTEAIRKRVVHGERPLAFLCSGGVDSCIVVAVAHEILMEIGKADQMHVFSMRYDDPQSQSEDAMYADMFLSNLGVAHTQVSFCKENIPKYYPDIVKACETYDPNTLRAALPMYLLAKHIAETTDFKVPVVGSDVWLCDDAYIHSGVTIGDGAVVAANSVVTKDVEPYSVVAGSPARVVKHRFAPDIVDRVLAVRWWELPDDVVATRLAPLLGSPAEFLAAAESARQEM